jgi:ribosomal 50S subunit-recycling heat shock protein
MSADRCRVDVWLWRARFFKSRALAGDCVSAGRVRLARDGSVRRLEKPASLVATGDRLLFPTPDGRLRHITVLALGERRGPASEARLLYTEDVSSLDEA